MADSQPLFVRLPQAAADRLDRAAQDHGVSKREIITRLIAQDDLAVGHHAFRAAPEPAVLTLAEAAGLLRTDEQTVEALTESGDLPGRRVGGQWRFGREAVLRWLGESPGGRR